jgi:hypothetical protein
LQGRSLRLVGIKEQIQQFVTVSEGGEVSSRMVAAE